MSIASRAAKLLLAALLITAASDDPAQALFEPRIDICGATGADNPGTNCRILLEGRVFEQSNDIDTADQCVGSYEASSQDGGWPCCTGAQTGTCDTSGWTIVSCIGAADPIPCCTGPGTGNCSAADRMVTRCYLDEDATCADDPQVFLPVWRTNCDLACRSGSDPVADGCVRRWEDWSGYSVQDACTAAGVPKACCDAEDLDHPSGLDCHRFDPDWQVGRDIGQDDIDKKPCYVPDCTPNGMACASGQVPDDPLSTGHTLQIEGGSLLPATWSGPTETWIVIRIDSFQDDLGETSGGTDYIWGGSQGGFCWLRTEQAFGFDPGGGGYNCVRISDPAWDVPTDEWLVVGAWIDSAGNASIEINRADRTDPAATAFPLSSFFTGSYVFSGFKGEREIFADIAFLLAYMGNLTEAERTDLVGYLDATYDPSGSTNVPGIPTLPWWGVLVVVSALTLAVRARRLRG